MARPLLERAHAQARDADLLARIEASLAYVSADMGDPARARELCEQALARPHLAAETRGVVQSQLALLQMRAGETGAALASFGSAISSLTTLPADLGKAHLNRGGVYLQRGQSDRAARDFRDAAVHLEAAGLRVEAAMARHNLGYTYLLRGDLVEALTQMDAARLVLAPLSPVHEATCDQDRAEVLIAAGLTAQGREALRNAARAYATRGLRRRRAEAEWVLARTLVHTHPSEALAAARRARDNFDRSDTEAWRVRAEAVMLSAEVELGRKGPSLVGRGDDLVARLTEQGLPWGAASVRVHTARVLIRRDEIDLARRRLKQVRLTADAPLSLRLLAHDVRGELAQAQGRRTAALMHLRSGLGELHGWQSSFGSLDLQTMVVGHGARLARRGLALAVESGKPAVVYEWSERARMLASRVQPVRVPADEQMATDLAELRKLAVTEDAPKVPAPRRAHELRDRVRERAWQVRGSGEVTEPAALDDVRRGLGPDTALVAWVVTPERVTGLVVTEDRATVHDLGSRADLDDPLDGLLPDLDVAASDLPDVLARSVRAQLAARLEDLATMLVAPLADRIGDRAVVLTPSGLLAGTPWTLLPGLVGRPVTVARSATSWLAARSPLGLASAGFVAGPRVVRAEQEVTEAGARWAGAEVLTGDKATADAVAQLAGQVDVLHIAAHGRHSGDNPLFSGLELVGGPWFGYDIDQLGQVPAVVLLSACEVGRSSVRYGEELIGMTAAWLHAGARCVIASPAAVSDEAAHGVLTAVHAGMAAGLDPAAALAKAVGPVSEDRPPAPFVCFS